MNKEWVETAMRLADELARQHLIWQSGESLTGTSKRRDDARAALKAHLNTPNTDPTPEPTWKRGNEFAPYHPSASHINPDHRDGWNACFKAAQERIAELEAQRDSAVPALSTAACLPVESPLDEAPGHRPLTQEQADGMNFYLRKLYDDKISKWERLGDRARVLDLKAEAVGAYSVLCSCITACGVHGMTFQTRSGSAEASRPNDPKD